MSIDDVISNAPAQRQTAGADFQASPSIGKLAGALAKAQGAFEAIGKTREVEVRMKDRDGRPGGTYKFAYAPLDEVLRAVRPAMASNGLALTQTISGAGAGRTMTTTLLHESGEWMSSTTTLPGQANTAQEFGSQITYMRRYAIVSILGVVADEDDDANAADGNSAEGKDRKATPPTRQQVQEQTQSFDRAVRLTKLLTAKAPDGCEWPLVRVKAWAKRHFKVDSSQAMTQQQLQDGEILALAFLTGGDVAYRAKLQELVATGRVFDDGKTA